MLGACLNVERLSTGVPELDRMLAGEIPRGFSVAVTGEPGTGTAFSASLFHEPSNTKLYYDIYTRAEILNDKR